MNDKLRNDLQPDVARHFENIKMALQAGLQRGIFSDFDTVIQIKISIDVVGQFLRQHNEPFAHEPAKEIINHLQNQS